MLSSGLLNARYLHLPEYKVRCIAQERGVYNAFPGGVKILGDSIVAIYSSGVGHGQSDRQIWVKSSDRFEYFETGTFLENATGVYDNSFLSELTQGESINFKSVFTVKNVSGTLTNFTTPVVMVTDQYALWGVPVLVGGEWLTTGYRISGGYERTALFKSTDGMGTWQFVTLIATSGARKFTEASLAECSNGDLIAVVRDNSTSTRDLYLTRRPNGSQVWGTPAMLPNHIKGTQPNLLRLSSGDVVLFAGDRIGASTLDDNGNHTGIGDITGIACWKSRDNGSSWGDATMIAPSWGTDCGQPVSIELPDGNIGLLCYLAPAATNGNLGIETGIYWIEFDPSALS